MIKLKSRIIHTNGPENTEVTVVLAEPKSGVDYVVSLSNNRGQFITIDSSILAHINGVLNELIIDVNPMQTLPPFIPVGLAYTTPESAEPNPNAELKLVDT